MRGEAVQRAEKLSWVDGFVLETARAGGYFDRMGYLMIDKKRDQPLSYWFVREGKNGTSFHRPTLEACIAGIFEDWPSKTKADEIVKMQRYEQKLRAEWVRE